MLLCAIWAPRVRPPFGDSALQAPELLNQTPPMLVALEGLLGWFTRKIGWKPSGRKGPQGKRHPKTVHMLVWLRRITILCWLFVIAGFGGHGPVIVMAVGLFALSAFSSAAIGVSHRWLVPLYTFTALVFSNGNVDLSVDAYLTEIYGSSYWFPPATSGVLRSGLGSKLVMVSAGYSLIAGGTSKLINGGLFWMDGRSLAFYIKNTPSGGVPFLKTMMANSPLMLFFLATTTIIFELASIVPFFVPSLSLRVVWLVICLGFHFGIWATMNPSYLPQSITYFLILPLDRVFEEMTSLPPSLWGYWPVSAPMVAAPVAHVDDLTAAIVVWSVNLFCVFLVVIALYRIEWWPLSSIPMYSFYRGGFSVAALKSSEQLDILVEECKSTRYPYALGWSPRWFCVKLEVPPVADEYNGKTVHVLRPPPPKDEPNTPCSPRNENRLERLEEQMQRSRKEPPLPEQYEDVVALLNSRKAAIPKALLRQLFMSVVRERLWIQGDERTLAAFPADGPSPAHSFLVRVIRPALVSVVGPIPTVAFGKLSLIVNYENESEVIATDALTFESCQLPDKAAGLESLGTHLKRTNRSDPGNLVEDEFDYSVVNETSGN
eukprot:gb/GEZN01002290.1/.p1 GENE.gb/GEZN01002290.1/~~gb/GEZN01002290.1/.p1  ORF type:complete len:674 (-),score=82.59 gb/GEZN01002290.1/:528-2336(-)